MSKYRLSPKPGIIRAGKFVKTQVTPTIVLKNNVARIQQPTPKIPKVKSSQPKPSPAQPPQSPKPPPPAVKKRNQGIKTRSQPRRNSPRLKTPRDQPKHAKAIEGLRNIGEGRALIMVACGPSVDEVDFDPIKDHPMVDIMLINKPYSSLHPAKYWVFCDQSQYLRNKDIFDNYRGTIINAWSVRARHQNQIMVKNRPGRGFSRDLLQGYHIGRSTTYANMQTALWMNYDKIYIFGCDMDPKGVEKFGKLHHYGTNPDVDPKIRAKRFEAEAGHYANAAKILSPTEKAKFVFCSSHNPWPFVNEFNKLDHQQAVKTILLKAETLLAVKNKLQED